MYLTLSSVTLLSTGYDCCGAAVSEDDLAALRADMGTLAERRWSCLEWDMPNDEACSCWWVATVDGIDGIMPPRADNQDPSKRFKNVAVNWNACDPDKNQPVKMVCRSLAVLRLELHNSRVASTDKLRKDTLTDTVYTT